MLAYSGNGIVLLMFYLDSIQSFKAIAMEVEKMWKTASIKQHINWTGTRHQRYVDYGFGDTTIKIDNLPFVKNAFVIIVVG